MLLSNWQGRWTLSRRGISLYRLKVREGRRGQSFLFPDSIHDVRKPHAFPASCCPRYCHVVKCNLWYSEIHFLLLEFHMVRDGVLLSMWLRMTLKLWSSPILGLQTCNNTHSWSVFLKGKTRKDLHVGPTASGFFVAILSVGRVGRKVLGASLSLLLLVGTCGCPLGA